MPAKYELPGGSIDEDRPATALKFRRPGRSPAHCFKAGARARRAFEDNYARRIGVGRILRVLGLEGSEAEEACDVGSARDREVTPSA